MSSGASSGEAAGRKCQQQQCDWNEVVVDRCVFGENQGNRQEQCRANEWVG
jgi:hypothetical protein